MKLIVFVTLMVRFLLPCDSRANSLNDPYLNILASGVLDSLRSYNRSPVVGSRTALMFIISDIKSSSGADR